MYREDLVKYLSGEMSHSEFSHLISKELNEFKKGLKIKGGSAPIIYHGDKGELKIKKEHLKLICSDFLSGTSSEYFVCYIVDALLISENTLFENEDLRERFEMLTDFEDQLEKDTVLQACMF